MLPFRKKLIFHGSIFLIFILVIGGALFFLENAMDAHATEIEKTRKELYSWIVSLESFAAIRSEYATKGEKYSAILKNRLPEKESLIDLKKDFQFLAASEGLTLSLAFNSEIENSSAKLGEMGITFTVHGPLENSIRFINRLNEVRFLVSIDSMTLSRKDDGTVDIEAKGQVFFTKS